MTASPPGSETPQAKVELRKLAPARNGVARFAATCACSTVTILYVPVAFALGAQAGGYQCDGCGLEHKFRVGVTMKGSTR